MSREGHKLFLHCSLHTSKCMMNDDRCRDDDEKWSIRFEKFNLSPRSGDLLLEIWAIYTEFLPSSQTIPALPTASNACSKEKKTFYSVSWIKRQ